MAVGLILDPERPDAFALVQTLQNARGNGQSSIQGHIAQLQRSGQRRIGQTCEQERDFLLGKGLLGFAAFDLGDELLRGGNEQS